MNAWRIGAVMALGVSLAADLGCALDSPYLDADGPRYEGDFVTSLPTDDGVVRVVTYNLEFGEDVDIAIEALRSPPLADFDVLAMQEMNPASMDELASALGLRYVYYPATVKRGSDFGNAILTRWPLARDHKILLPHADPYAASRRIAVSADLTIGDRVHRVYSVHAATMTVGLGARLDQIEAIALDARSTTRPTVIAGDFNTADPSSKDQTIELLRQHGFLWASPAALDSGSGYNARFTLDYVFARDLAVGDSGTFDGDSGSDHQPVWAELGIP